MRYAIIENGKVVSIAKSDKPLKPNWVEAGAASIGDSYDEATGEFTKPPEPPRQVPESVSMRKARLALHMSGLLAEVESAISSLPEPDRTEVSIEWEYAQSVDRNWPRVRQLTDQMGLTEQQVDDLFLLASTL